MEGRFMHISVFDAASGEENTAPLRRRRRTSNADVSI